jgi:hypothetical protein
MGYQKKEENSEKEKKTILDKFSIENLQKKNSEGNDDFFSLALSSINKIDEPPLKYGGLEEIGDDLAIKKKIKINRRVVHIATEDFGSHYQNLNLLFGGGAKAYKYYFIFMDGENHFHIQYAPKNPQLLDLEKFAPCEFLEPIQYDKFLNLLKNGQLIEVKFNTESLVLSRGGRPKKEEVEKVNETLKKYIELNELL